MHDLYCQIFSTYIANKSLKLSFILNCILKRADDLKTIPNWFVLLSWTCFRNLKPLFLNFPASRGLSRWGKMKREERDLCRLPTSFLSCMPSRFLNNQWCFCHMWHNSENRFEFERERERVVNLSVRSNFKWTDQSWSWNDLASVCCCEPHYKSLRKAEEANFKANFSFFMSLSTGEAQVFEVKFIGLYGTVGFVAIQDFSFWGESHLWSDVWPVMDGVVSLPTEVSHDEAKMKDLL